MRGDALGAGGLRGNFLLFEDIHTLHISVQYFTVFLTLAFQLALSHHLQHISALPFRPD